MAGILLNGQRTWKLKRDDEGHRTYSVTFIVQTTSVFDGPATVLLTPGLPIFGTFWIIDNDADLWAWCRWEADINPILTNEPNDLWECTFTFSTKPPDAHDRACRETQIEDPLLEPPKINGSFVQYQEEATYDRFGNPLVNSAFERLRGPQVEFDANRPQVEIEMNVPILDLALLAIIGNTVNAEPIWGMPPRTVKLSEIKWERKFWGSCTIYYTLKLTFDMRYDGFDRNLLDEATKVLNGQWDATSGAWDLVKINGSLPDHANPTHFIKFTDPQGNQIKGILNGAGLPGGVPTIGTSSASAYYMCIALGVHGVSPPSAQWQTFSFNVKLPTTVWSNAGTYLPGNVVTIGEVQLPGATIAYLCISAVANVGPVGLSPDQDPVHWQKLPVDDFGNYHVEDRGLYQASANYIAGDFVSLPESQRFGNLHIERYGESDFTILGVPLTF